jgi:hypothetical protein
MLGLEKQSPIIEDLRKHSSYQIAELRLLLNAGIVGRPDIHRPGFYELDGAESVYYVFRYPSGQKVLLIAVWQRVSTAKAA